MEIVEASDDEDEQDLVHSVSPNAAMRLKLAHTNRLTAVCSFAYLK